MVSAQINGSYAVYLVNPSGARRLVQSSAAYWWGPGGSSEGAIANTPEKWNILPLSADTGGPGYSIEVTLTAGAAATTDASDSAMVIPVVVNGNSQTIGNSVHAAGLGNANFTVDLAATDMAFVAGVETPYLRYRAKEGVYFKVGGGRTFVSIENNA